VISPPLEHVSLTGKNRFTFKKEGTTMKRRTYLIGALVVLTLLVTACGSTTAGTATKAATTTQSSSISCSLKPIKVTVRQGPDAGFSMQGG
jgi:hypothetical protein